MTNDHDSWHLPVLTLAVALFLSLCFQLQLMRTDRTALQQAKVEQQAALDQAKEVQQRLDSLAVGTLRLAEGGNVNAQALVERLKEAGITIKPPAAAAAPAVEQPAAKP